MTHKPKTFFFHSRPGKYLFWKRYCTKDIFLCFEFRDMDYKLFKANFVVRSKEKFSCAGKLAF